ncbi:amidase [Streptomyces sp. NPDC001139]
MTSDTDAVALSSATDLTTALREKRISSRELLEIYLSRVEQLNPGLNAVVTLDADRALDRAAAADRAAARGEWLGPLHGLPMTVKDTLETAGVRTTAGAAELSNHVPASDADAVVRLRRAGAVIFGKTNTATYASEAQTYNPVFGTTNNPWALDRTPGGSSGGAAAALAAGLTGLEVGGELSGSCRVPAHYCGVYTLRPTHGLVPTRGHIPRAPGWLTSNDMVTLAPLARNASDLDLALDVLVGPSEAQAVAWRVELPEPRATRLDDYRIGVWLDDPHCPLDGAVAAVLHAAVEALSTAGARLSEVRPIDRLAHDALYERLVGAATSLSLPQNTFTQLCAATGELPPSSDPFRDALRRGNLIRHRDWLVADEERTQARARWRAYFRDYDLLLCPVTTTTAIPHDHNPDFGARSVTVNGQRRSYWEQIRWTSMATAAALPAASVPVGVAADGLPVGLQIVGPHLEDRTVTHAARLITQIVGGFRVPSPMEGSAHATGDSAV